MKEDWKVARSRRVCGLCRTTLERNAEHFSALYDLAEQLVREDFCTSCWTDKGPIERLVLEPDGAPESAGEEGRRCEGSLFSVWKTRVPPGAVRRARLSSEELLEVFSDMLGREDEESGRFAYCLALLLMRRRVLKGTGKRADGNLHLVHPETKERYSVTIQQMTSEQMKRIDERFADVADNRS